MKGKIEMKKLGTYENLVCYEANFEEWLKMYKEGSYKKDIIIVNGVMVLDNMIYGYYDGQRVKEDYSKKRFYKEEEKVEKVVTKTADINFADYSKVVDDFFKSLEKEESVKYYDGQRMVGYLG